MVLSASACLRQYYARFRLRELRSGDSTDRFERLHRVPLVNYCQTGITAHIRPVHSFVVPVLLSRASLLEQKEARIDLRDCGRSP